MAAIGKRVVWGGQIELSAAYLKVTSINFNSAAGDEPFTASISVFRDKACRDANMPAIDGFNYRYPYVPGLDPLQAAYLKLPYVEGAGEVSPVLEGGQSLIDTPKEFLPPPPAKDAAGDAQADKPSPIVV